MGPRRVAAAVLRWHLTDMPSLAEPPGSSPPRVPFAPSWRLADAGASLSAPSSQAAPPSLPRSAFAYALVDAHRIRPTKVAVVAIVAARLALVLLVATVGAKDAVTSPAVRSLSIGRTPTTAWSGKLSCGGCGGHV